MQPDDPADELASSSGGRGADTRPRHRRQYADTDAGAAKWPDWTRCDCQVALKRLRSYDHKVITKYLRKLHL